MYAIFSRTMRDRRTVLIIYCVAVVAFLWMYISLFPFIRDQAQELDQLMNAYPEALKKAFNVESSQSLFSSLENYLAMEQYGFIWPIMVIAMMVSLGGGAIAAEIEKGTIDLLLSQPVSRLRIFLAKYLTGLLNLAIFVPISTFAAIPIAAAYKADYNLGHFWVISVIGFLFGWAVFSIAILLSSIFSEKGRVYFIAVGILLAMYVLNILASLKDSVSDLQYFSFFHYFNPSDLLGKGEIDNWSVVVFLGVVVVCSIASGLIFAKRDISTS